MKRFKRYWRRILIALVVLIVLVLGGVRWFLSSAYVTGRIAGTLEQMYGGKVRVGSAEIGTRTTVLRHVELYEKGQGPGQQPWLTIDRLETDVSLWDLLGNVRPTKVTLRGVTVLLRFDGDGRLLTQLPTAPKQGGTAPQLPEIDVTDGRIVMVDVNKRELVFDQLTAALKPQGNTHAFNGSAQNPSWGLWNIQGTADLAKDDLVATFQSPKVVHVTQPMLDALPMVSPKVWREVQLDGDLQIVTVLTDSATTSTFLVKLAASRTHLHIASIDLDTTNTSGNAEITDGKITLRSMTGRFADGTLQTDVDLDFPRDAVHIGILALKVDNVDLRGLPPRWSIPPQLAGRLFATTKLEMTVVAGKVQTRGVGNGEVRQATIAGQPTTGPIGLTLDSADGRTALRAEGELPPTDLALLANGFDVKLPPEIAGKLGLRFHTALPLDTLSDPLTFTASGKALGTPLILAGLSLEKASADWAYLKGDLDVHNLRGSLPGGPLTGHGTVRLQEPFPFRAELHTEELELAALDQLNANLRPPAPLRGKLTATTQLQGTLRPFVVTTSGTASASAIVVEGWNVTEASWRWQSTDNRVFIDQLKALAYDGTIAGTATLPLDAGPGKVQLRIDNLSVGRLARLRFGLDRQIDGKASGQVEVKLGPQHGDRPRNVSMRLELLAPRLDVDHLRTDNATLAVQYRRNELDYHAHARLLGGLIDISGELNTTDRARTASARPGHVRLQHIEVGKVLGLWSDADRPPLRGRIDADFLLRLDSRDFTPLLRGQVSLTDLVWQDQALASSAQASVVLEKQQFKVSNVSATLARGTLTAKGTFNLAQPDRSWFEATLDNADLAELLRPWPEVAQQCQGTVDLRVRGKLGSYCSGTCDAVITRGKIAGVAVNEWRLPARWSLTPSEGHGQLEVRDSHLQLPQGSATAQISAVWSTGLRLESQLKFVGVDLRQALPGLKTGNGRANGVLELNGEHIRTVDDLQGTLRATLTQTQALQFPILRQVAPLLGFQSTSTFQSGEVQARLSKGVVRVERMSFSQGALQMYVRGNVTLQGRIQLDITANTGKLGNIAAALGWRVPASGNIASELLGKATTALSPRLVNIHATGTIHEPTLQVVPLPMLTEPVLRFFAGL